MIDDVARLVATCEACQKLSHRYRPPAQPSQLIAPSWPLQRWGIDVVGKLTPTQGNNTFAIVTVEHFTKWVEAKSIIIDNTKYLDSAMFKDFCHQIGTKVSFTSLYHPQSNGAVERANALIFEVIKKILKGQKKGKWAEVMPRVL
jgi:hypothetical protein